MDTPGLLLFETNWWEDSYQRLVALKIQDETPISAAFTFQKGSEFVHLFNHFLKKLLEGGIIYKINKEQSCLNLPHKSNILTLFLVFIGCIEQKEPSNLYWQLMYIVSTFLFKWEAEGELCKKDWSMREELNFEVEPAVTLGYENLAFPFLILLGGLFVACIITSCEKIGNKGLLLMGRLVQ